MEHVCTETDASQTETNVKNYRIPIFFGRQESKFSALRSKFPARNPLNQYVFSMKLPENPSGSTGGVRSKFFFGMIPYENEPLPFPPRRQKTTKN